MSHVPTGSPRDVRPRPQTRGAFPNLHILSHRAFPGPDSSIDFPEENHPRGPFSPSDPRGKLNDILYRSAPKAQPLMNGTLDDLNAILAAWGPEFEVLSLPSQGRLYEPDGTLYAILLSGQTELRTDRRRRAIHRGDLVVVPQSVAVEVEPDADFLALRVSGPPPYHFRERFIQVQGFEHVAGASGEILDDDARHRLGYRVIRVESGTACEFDLPTNSRALVVTLDGQVAGIDQPDAWTQATGQAVGLSGETARLMLTGLGSVALFLLSGAEAHRARRLARFAETSAPVSPESPTEGIRGEISTRQSGAS